MIIDSVQNPRIKRLVALRKRRDRDDAGVTVAEGYDEVKLAINAGVAARELYYCRELMPGPQQLGLLNAVSCETIELSRAAFEKASYRESPDGWLAVIPTPQTRLDQVKLPKNALVLLCEGIEKPGNLGAMLRTADAAGVDAVVAVSTVTDWGNPNTVRASKGTLFTVPVATAGRDEVVNWCKQNGLKLVAATPSAEANFTDVDLSGPVAIAVGAEHEGLTDEIMAASDIRVLIPMVGKVNSLNVATSAALWV